MGGKKKKSLNLSSHSLRWDHMEKNYDGDSQMVKVEVCYEATVEKSVSFSFPPFPSR